MTPEQRGKLTNEQSVITEFAGEDAFSTLNALLSDDVDRVRAVNVVYEIAGPVENMDAPTIAMFKRLIATLKTMPRDWRDPEPNSAGAAGDTADKFLVQPSDRRRMSV